MNLKQIKTALLLSTTLAVTGCDVLADIQGESGQFYFSNPEAQAMTLTVDDEAFTLQPDEVGQVTLSEGLHSMQWANGPKISFLVYPENKGGILNPQNKVYYSYSMIYANGDDVNRFSPAVNKVMIDGVPYEDAIHSTNSLIIDQNLFKCHFPIGTPFPDELVTYDKKSIGNIKNKCFTKKEFVAFYSAELGEPMPKVNADDQGNTITDVYAEVVPKAEFTDPATQEVAKKMETMLTEFVASKEASAQKAAQSQFHELSMAMVTAQSESAAQQTVAENKRYNQFMLDAGHILGAGVALK